jgi:hypothetical protein
MEEPRGEFTKIVDFRMSIVDWWVRGLDQKTVGLLDADVVEERKTIMLLFRCQPKV